MKMPKSTTVKTFLFITGLSMVMWPVIICLGGFFSKNPNASDDLSFNLLKKISEISGISGLGPMFFVVLLIVGFIIITKSAKRTNVPENEDYSKIKE